MKRIAGTAAVILIAAGCSDTGQGTPADASMDPPDLLAAFAPTTTQHDEVVATLQLLFDALEAGDEALLRSVLDAAVVMQFTETRDGTTTNGSSTLDGLASRITGGGATLIERMWDPVVVVSGALATIWTPYDFYSGETFSHCGVDSASLIRTADGWKIVALSWTRLQPPTCELHPDGPPAG